MKERREKQIKMMLKFTSELEKLASLCGIVINTYVQRECITILIKKKDEDMIDNMCTSLLCSNKFSFEFECEFVIKLF